MEILGLISVPTWTVFMIPIVVALYMFLTWRFDELKQLGHSGPKPYPFVGNFHLLVKHGMYDIDLIMSKKYGKVYSFIEGRDPTLVVGDRKILKNILVKDFANFVDRKPLYLRGILEAGVFDARGMHWKQLRNYLTPSFSTGKLKQMIGAIQQCAKVMTSHLEKYADKKEDFEAKSVGAAFTMDVIARTVFSLDLNTQEDPNNVFVEKSTKFFKFSILDPLPFIMFVMPYIIPPLRAVFNLKSVIPADTEQFFTSFLEQMLEERRLHPSNHKDFVQMMLDAENDAGKEGFEEETEMLDQSVPKKKGLTKEEILAQCFLFFIAGYETTGTTLGFVLYYLATNPEVQVKAQAEVDQVLENKTDVDYEDIAKLNYVEMIINETLRIQPPVCRLDRMASRDVDYDGFKIPKGMAVTYPIRLLHMDPEVYPEPDMFIPERFSAEEKANRDPISFIPFGAGPRACIGMRLAIVEMKMVVALILKSFSIVPSPKTPIPLVLEKNFFPIAKGGLHLRVERR